MTSQEQIRHCMYSKPQLVLAVHVRCNERPPLSRVRFTFLLVGSGESAGSFPEQQLVIEPSYNGRRIIEKFAG